MVDECCIGEVDSLQGEGRHALSRIRMAISMKKALRDGEGQSVRGEEPVRRNAFESTLFRDQKSCVLCLPCVGRLLAGGLDVSEKPCKVQGGVTSVGVDGTRRLG